jgi:hypothetical protein
LRLTALRDYRSYSLVFVAFLPTKIMSEFLRWHYLFEGQFHPIDLSLQIELLLSWSDLLIFLLGIFNVGESLHSLQKIVNVFRTESFRAMFFLIIFFFHSFFDNCLSIIFFSNFVVMNEKFEESYFFDFSSKLRNCLLLPYVYLQVICYRLFSFKGMIFWAICLLTILFPLII